MPVAELTLPPSPPAWAAGLFDRPLVLVAQGPSPGATVWAMKGDRIAGHISEQFKAGAAEYHARYASAGHFQALFQNTLTKLVS